MGTRSPPYRQRVRTSHAEVPSRALSTHFSFTSLRPSSAYGAIFPDPDAIGGIEGQRGAPWGSYRVTKRPIIRHPRIIGIATFGIILCIAMTPSRAEEYSISLQTVIP